MVRTSFSKGAGEFAREVEFLATTLRGGRRPLNGARRQRDEIGYIAQVFVTG